MHSPVLNGGQFTPSIHSVVSCTLLIVIFMQDMDNEYTTAAKNMIDQAVEDRDNGVITLAEFYKICTAAVTIFQTKVGA